MKKIRLFKQFINEASFHTFLDENIVNDKFITDFIKSDDSAYYLLNYFIEVNDLDEDDSDDIEKSPEYHEFVKDEFYGYLESTKDNLYDKIDYNTNKIKIYRAITVDDNWIDHIKKQGKRLGIYWSWDIDGAETHWGDPKKKKEALIESEIDEKYVDWIETFRLNIHPSYNEEREIRLFKNTPIKINSIKIDGDEIDIEEIRNKIFYS